MDIVSGLILFAGGVLGGIINVMAGGAGFMTFPLLIAAGLTEMQANAANFVALLPANIAGSYVYKHEIRQVRKYLVLRLCLAALGGALGSFLFIWLGEASFHRAIPWLLVFATISFAVGPAVKRWLERHQALDASRWLIVSLFLEFMVYVYGGYFGLGMGIILLAIHSIFSHMNVHQANALRNVTISLMTVISIAIFSTSGMVLWLPSLIMMMGAVVGGYGMAKIALKIPADRVRLAILAWSVVLTGFSFWRYG